jgi:hypothetical protein
VTVEDRLTHLRRTVAIVDVRSGALAAGQTRSYAFALGGPLAPQAGVTVTADALGAVTEADETDNARTIDGRAL